MKCTINKLAAVVSDNSLPVLTGLVVLKNYITTTQDNQYISIASILSQIGYSSMKVDVTLKHTGTATGQSVVFQSENGYAFIYANTALRLTTHIGSVTQDNVTVQANTDVSCGFDGYGNKCWVGTTETAGSGSISSSAPSIANLFANRSGESGIAGAVKIKEVKVYDDGVLVADLVPATYDGVACLYDKVNEVPYYEANSGTLSVE